MCNQHTGASRARPEPLTRCRTQFSQSEWPSKKLLIPMAGSVGQARCPARPSAETQGSSSQSPRPTPTELAVVRPEAKCPPGPCRAPTPSPQRGIKAGFTGGISRPGPGGPMPRSSLGTRQHHPHQECTQRNWGASHAHPEPPWRGPPVPPSPGLVVEKGPHLPVPIPLLWGPGQSWA